MLICRSRSREHCRFLYDGLRILDTALTDDADVLAVLSLMLTFQRDCP